MREANSEDVREIAMWLACPEISQWFDFGLGRQALSTLAVQAMVQSDRNRIRVFGAVGTTLPSGVVAIGDVTHRFGLGSFWVLRDHRRAACPHMTLDASKRMLRDGFEIDRLHCIGAWVVQDNIRSQRLLARLGFCQIGLQRNCHLVGGQRVGRLLYDLLPENLT